MSKRPRAPLLVVDVGPCPIFNAAWSLDTSKASHASSCSSTPQLRNPPRSVASSRRSRRRSRLLRAGLPNALLCGATAAALCVRGALAQAAPTTQEKLAAVARLEGSGLDVTGDGVIEVAEFMTVVDRPDAMAALTEIGVKVGEINAIRQIVFVQSSTELTMSELVDQVLQASDQIIPLASDGNPTLPPTPAPRDFGVNEKGEWIMQRFKGSKTMDINQGPAYYTTSAPERADECFNEFTGVGSQQSWKRVIGGGQHCFYVTSELELGENCRTQCTAKVFCSRGGNSGVKLRFYKGQNCLRDPAEEIWFMNQLTWPQLHGVLYGDCSTRADGFFEKFVTPWNVGTDFPNCYGYDYSTQGAGIVTADPKDSPYTLKIYSDVECTLPFFPGLDANASGQPIWTSQRWMSALRKEEESKRTPNLEHCWIIETGAPPMTFFGSIKLTCDNRDLNRMMMYVEHYDDVKCEGGTGGVAKERETFYQKMGYEVLASGMSDVEETSQFFKGACKEFGGKPKTYWKFDRPVHFEDWPDCFAIAERKNIRVRRPSMSELDFTGDIGTPRVTPKDNCARPALGVGVLLGLLVMASA